MRVVALGLITCRKNPLPSMAAASLMPSGTKPRADEHYYRGKKQEQWLQKPTLYLRNGLGRNEACQFLEQFISNLIETQVIPKNETTQRDNESKDNHGQYHYYLTEMRVVALGLTAYLKIPWPSLAEVSLMSSGIKPRAQTLLHAANQPATAAH